MSRKFPPAKIIVNRGIAAQAYRHPRENFLKQISVVLGGLTLAAVLALPFVFLKAGVLFYAGAALMIIVLGLHVRLKQTRLIGQALQVSEENFPEIHYIQTVVARALNYSPAFTIYVSAGEKSAARWLSAGGHPTLVLNSTHVEAMISRAQIGQLIWLVSRMMALQWTRHQSWLVTRALLVVAHYNPLTWPVSNRYRRITHLTADRLGLALNLSLIDAAEALKTLLAGGALSARASFDQIEKQGQRHNLFTVWHETLNAQPSLARRFLELLEFCREQFPDLYADFELHRKYTHDLLPSFRDIQQFSEGKEEERRLQREIGKTVYELMSAKPPRSESDSISRAFFMLHRNRGDAAELDGKINRLNLAKASWEKTVSSIAGAEQKRETATRALETHYREIGRAAFQALSHEIATNGVLKKIFEKALQYQVVITDRENEIARLEAASGNVIDKSKRQMEILALRTQNSTDAKRLHAAAEAVGEEFWKTCAEQYEHDEIEPIKLRITGVIAELERRRVELENLHAQKRQIESDLEKEGLESSARPDVDAPFLVEQLKNQARAANALRPRLLEELGKTYWQNETNPAPETVTLIAQLHDLKKRIRAFEQDDM